MRNCSCISRVRESCAAMFSPYRHGKSSLIMCSSFLGLGRLKLSLQHAFSSYSGPYIINFYIISLSLFILLIDLLKTQHSKNENHGIWSHHFMANRWGNNENSDRLNFGGSKITADDDCSHEINRHLLLGRKAMTNLDSILKS